MKNEVSHAPASTSRSAGHQRAKRLSVVLPGGEALLGGDAFKARDTLIEAHDDDVTAVDGSYGDKIRDRAQRLAGGHGTTSSNTRRITRHTVSVAGLAGAALARFSKAQTVVVAPARVKALARRSLVRRLVSRKSLSRAIMAIVAVWVAIHPTTRAVAENVVGQWRHPVPSAVLTDPRDPKDFVADLAIVMPRPTIVLTRQDAVARELLVHVRTLPTREVLRTAQAISEEAEKLGYDPLLFLALIHIESYYDHLALSPVGAEGLMQLMPPTAEWMAGRLDVRWDEGHTFDPVLNVRLGSEYLAYLYREFGRMDYALTAYNRGPHATRYLVDRFGHLPPEIHDFYAGKVLTYYEKLKAMYGKLPMG